MSNFPEIDRIVAFDLIFGQATSALYTFSNSDSNHPTRLSQIVISLGSQSGCYRECDIVAAFCLYASDNRVEQAGSVATQIGEITGVKARLLAF